MKDWRPHRVATLFGEPDEGATDDVGVAVVVDAAPAAAGPVLETRGVVKRFGAATAVDHADLTVEDGELFTLLGPSGCGKSTALRIIAGLGAATSGTALSVGAAVVTPTERRGASLPRNSTAPSKSRR